MPGTRTRTTTCSEMTDRQKRLVLYALDQAITRPDLVRDLRRAGVDDEEMKEIRDAVEAGEVLIP